MYDRVQQCMHCINNIVGDKVFYTCMWKCILSFLHLRRAANNFMFQDTFSSEYIDEMDEDDKKLMVKAVAASFRNSQQLFVRSTVAFDIKNLLLSKVVMFDTELRQKIFLEYY